MKTIFLSVLLVFLTNYVCFGAGTFTSTTKGEEDSLTFFVDPIAAKSILISEPAEGWGNGVPNVTSLYNVKDVVWAIETLLKGDKTDENIEKINHILKILKNE